MLCEVWFILGESCSHNSAVTVVWRREVHSSLRTAVSGVTLPSSGYMWQLQQNRQRLEKLHATIP